MISGPTASPTSASTGASGAGSRILDSAPPMPSSQKRAQTPLFTPPMGEGSGMGALGGDPMIRTMSAAKQVDMAFQELAMLYPAAVQAMAGLQMQFRQLVTELMMAQTQPMGGGAAGGGIMPPLPMQGGTNPGMQQGPGI